jgi:hypothetical protein
MWGGCAASTPWDVWPRAHEGSSTRKPLTGQASAGKKGRAALILIARTLTPITRTLTPIAQILTPIARILILIARTLTPITRTLTPDCSYPYSDCSHPYSDYSYPYSDCSDYSHPYSDCSHLVPQAIRIDELHLRARSHATRKHARSPVRYGESQRAMWKMAATEYSTGDEAPAPSVRRPCASRPCPFPC